MLPEKRDRCFESPIRNAVGLPGWLEVYAAVNFLHFAFYLFAACVAVLVVVSLATAPPDRRRIADLTYATVESSDDPRAASRPARRRQDLALTLVLAALVGDVWRTSRG
ncbi:MAG: hypothetical protein JW940_36980 [Polyangiaceae bacterium]|nr:hypothetical protein [Polyangiaceae bacterium]